MNRSIRPSSSPSTDAVASSRRTPLLIGGVVALAVIATLMSILVLGRGPVTGAGKPSPTPIPSVPATPEPSQEPSDSPAPSDSPRPQPSVQPEPSEQPVVTPAPKPSAQPLPKPAVLPAGSMARVLVDALNVRIRPGLDAELVDTVRRGEILVINHAYLIAGMNRTDEDGYTWYPVVVLGTTEVPGLDEQAFDPRVPAWAALGTPTAAFVEPIAPRCVDDSPDLAMVEKMLAWERVACFGDRPITLEGTYGCGGCGGFIPGSYEPAWLASPMNYEFLSVDVNEALGPLTLRFGPSSPETVPVGSMVRVTGHFNDAASETCVIWAGMEEVLVDSAVAELHCRSQFVVDSIENLGPDPDFPDF